MTEDNIHLQQCCRFLSEKELNRYVRDGHKLRDAFDTVTRGCREERTVVAEVIANAKRGPGKKIRQYRESHEFGDDLKALFISALADALHDFNRSGKIKSPAQHDLTRTLKFITHELNNTEIEGIQDIQLKFFVRDTLATTVEAFRELLREKPRRHARKRNAPVHKLKEAIEFLDTALLCFIQERTREEREFVPDDEMDQIAAALPTQDDEFLERVLKDLDENPLSEEDLHPEAVADPTIDTLGDAWTEPLDTGTDTIGQNATNWAPLAGADAGWSNLDQGEDGLDEDFSNIPPMEDKPRDPLNGQLDALDILRKEGDFLSNVLDVDEANTQAPEQQSPGAPQPSDPERGM